MIVRKRWILGTILVTGVSAQAYPIFGGNDYDAATGTGGIAMSGQLGPPRVSNTGFATGNGDSRVNNVSKGYGVFRWSPTLAPEILGSLGNDNNGRSFPKSTAINAAGVVVGSATRSPNGVSNNSKPARWDLGTTVVTELDPADTSFTAGAVGIDAAGNVFGNVGSTASFPRRWMGGSTTSLPMLTLGAPATGSGTGTVSVVSATGIVGGSATLYNASGQSTGTRAVRWNTSDAAPTELGMYNGSSAKLAAINDLGAIVGRFGTPGVYYAPNSATPTLLLDLEAGITRGSQGLDVGNGGAVIGWANKYTNGVYQYDAPVIWPTATSTPIELQSENRGNRTSVTAVNSTGHSVGQTYDLANNIIKAWLWSIDGSGVDIQSFVDDPKWTIQNAADLSDTGWVVGEGVYDPDGIAGPIASYRRFYSILIPQAGTYGIGDANFDTHINFDDLLVIAQHYGENANGRVDVADFDLNGVTNFDDLLTVAQNYESAATFSRDWARAQSLVPEPMSALLLTLGAASIRRRRSGTQG